MGWVGCGNPAGRDEIHVNVQSTVVVVANGNPKTWEPTVRVLFCWSTVVVTFWAGEVWLHLQWLGIWLVRFQCNLNWNGPTDASQVTFWFIISLQIKLLRHEEIIPSGHRTTAMSKQSVINFRIGSITESTISFFSTKIHNFRIIAFPVTRLKTAVTFERSILLYPMASQQIWVWFNADFGCHYILYLSLFPSSVLPSSSKRMLSLKRIK